VDDGRRRAGVPIEVECEAHARSPRGERPERRPGVV